jgi:hypothetical protein
VHFGRAQFAVLKRRFYSATLEDARIAPVRGDEWFRLDQLRTTRRMLVIAVDTLRALRRRASSARTREFEVSLMMSALTASKASNAMPFDVRGVD